MVMLAAFLVLIFVIPPAYTSVFMFLFFFLLYVIRGFEEWKFERKQKSTTTRGLVQLFLIWDVYITDDGYVKNKRTKSSLVFYVKY
ncbi:hypothetical protein AAAC51_25580 [Priestia megaterium]